MSCNLIIFLRVMWTQFFYISYLKSYQYNTVWLTGFINTEIQAFESKIVFSLTILGRLLLMTFVTQPHRRHLWRV
jgi:hypothetical protein